MGTGGSISLGEGRREGARDSESRKRWIRQTRPDMIQLVVGGAFLKGLPTSSESWKPGATPESVVEVRWTDEERGRV
jgi:hypothetical protein